MFKLITCSSWLHFTLIKYNFAQFSLANMHKGRLNIIYILMKIILIKMDVYD